MPEVFKPTLALLNTQVQSLDEAGRLMLKGMNVNVDPKELVTTFIGGGVSIMHTRHWVDVPTVAFMRPLKPLSEDGVRVEYIFLVVSPKDDPDAHLIALARIARLMTRPEVKQKLSETHREQEVINVFQEFTG